MAKTSVTLGKIVNELHADTGVLRSAIITAPKTGNRTLDEIRLRFARHAVAIKYGEPPELDELVARCRGSMDLVMCDPTHGYGASVHCLERCLELLRPGGILISHDCVPRPDTATVERTAALEWCGVTFAAFRDVMTARGARWCTLAADFGLGLAVAPAPGAHGEEATGRWTPETHDAYLGQFVADPFGFMRTVRPESWRAAIDRLRADGDVRDLAAPFGSWDDLIPAGFPVTRKSRLPRPLQGVVRALLGPR